MSEPVVYLDHAASTPMRPEAVAAMLPFLSDHPGNPSGGHGAARAAKTALEEAREIVAGVLGAAPDEVIFTAGGTEADNLAVKGGARAARRVDGLDGVVTTAFEHKGVLAAAHRLEQEGFGVVEAAVTTAGIVDVEDLAARLDDRTALVSVMGVNNELGTIQPLPEIATVVRRRVPHARLHTDAVQAVPWVDVSELAASFDLVAISGHKFGGPKGVGALVQRRGVALDAEIEGGGQERGVRAGTVNVAGVVALATALRITHERRRRGDHAHRVVAGSAPGGSARRGCRRVRERRRHAPDRGSSPHRLPRRGERGAARAPRPAGAVCGGGQLVLVGRDRDLPRARRDGHGPFPRARHRCA